MRFQGNERNLLENSSNVKGHSDVTYRVYESEPETHLGTVLLAVDLEIYSEIVLCCDLFLFLFWSYSIGVIEWFRLEGNLKIDHQAPTPLPWAGLPDTRLGCPGPCPT